MELFEKNDRGQLEPERLWNRMSAEDQASVTALAKNVGPYYSSMSGAPFFPEYTLHGIDHVRNVISFANKLIPDPTPDSLTSREIAYLFSAIMIHDIGMFLTEDGFKSLVEGAYSDNQIPGIDSASWNSEWGSYIERVRRYPDTKLIKLLGDDAPVESVCLDPDRMQKRDRLVCGDFLRIYHGRLAHEIAINMFMGTKDVNIFRNTSFDDEDRDLIGLIARSHCMNMHDTESYLNSLFGEVERPRNARIFYLMSLLRIADYLDAGRNRAPEALTYRQDIISPISRNEWEWNNQIDERSYTWNSKRKRLNIDASPSTTSQFVMVEKWLNSIQTELDMSWAFLHEKYPEDCPSLSIHRITSRLLQDECRETYKRQFVINDMRLHVNPSILRLLIAPLYGNNPSFGVRELLQNAVDACREREYLKQDEKYKGKVTISIDTNDKTLVITDNGIGMTEDVLRDYFLSIGSSYRESDEWKQNYTVNRKSEVARTGKFGIGVLSAFLLGDAVNVTTRSVNDTLGYQFDFAMETSCIDIKRVRADIGTTIKIHLNSASLDQFSDLTFKKRRRETSFGQIYFNSLRWTEWYYYANPEVRYYIDGIEVNHINQRLIIPETGSNNSWHSMDNIEYESYLWSYSFQTKSPKLSEIFTFCEDRCSCIFCNGIPMGSYLSSAESIRPFDNPVISIIDKQGRLDCNLSRSELQSVPSYMELKYEISRFVLSQILLHEFSSLDDLFFYPQGLRGLCTTENSDLRNNGIPIPSFFVFSKDGYLPNISGLDSISNVGTYLQIGYDATKLHSHRFSDTCSSEQFKDFLIEYSKTSLLPLLPCATINDYKFSELYLTSLFEDMRFDSDGFVAIRILPSSSSLYRKHLSFLSDRSHEVEYYALDDNCGYMIYSKSFDSSISKSILSEITSYNIRPLFIRSTPNSNPSNYRLPLRCQALSGLMHDLLGTDTWIPFDLNERQTKFPKAFSVLSDYL